MKDPIGKAAYDYEDKHGDYCTSQAFEDGAKWALSQWPTLDEYATWLTTQPLEKKTKLHCYDWLREELEAKLLGEDKP